MPPHASQLHLKQLKKILFSKLTSPDLFKKFLAKQSHKQKSKSRFQTPPNQQQSMKHCLFFKLQFIDRISIQIKKEICEFLCAYDIKLIMFHQNFTIGTQNFGQK